MQATKPDSLDVTEVVAAAIHQAADIVGHEADRLRDAWHRAPLLPDGVCYSVAEEALLRMETALREKADGVLAEGRRITVYYASTRTRMGRSA